MDHSSAGATSARLARDLALVLALSLLLVAWSMFESLSTPLAGDLTTGINPQVDAFANLLGMLAVSAFFVGSGTWAWQALVNYAERYCYPLPHPAPLPQDEQNEPVRDAFERTLDV